MMTDDVKRYLQPVCDIAHEAGRKILTVYNREFDIEHKEDRTPLTEADIAAHDVIMAGLSGLTPDLPVLSEESAAIPYETRRQWQRYWLVDPLDGTREFIKRNGEFTVNIALIDNQVPILGVIVVPVTDMCYYACRGHGAWKQADGEQAVQINVRRFNPGHVVVAGSRSHGSERMQAFLQRLGDYELVSMGSSLKSCLVAEGKADIYARLGLTSEWDTAAAQCVVEEAGGRLVEISMQQLRYNTKDSLLNPEFLVIGDDSHDWQQYLPD